MNEKHDTELDELVNIIDDIIFQEHYHHINKLKPQIKNGLEGFILAKYTPNDEVSRLVREARLLGRKDIANKAVEHAKNASFFQGTARVALVSNLEWLASLDQPKDSKGEIDATNR